MDSSEASNRGDSDTRLGSVRDVNLPEQQDATQLTHPLAPIVREMRFKLRQQNESHPTPTKSNPSGIVKHPGGMTTTKSIPVGCEVPLAEVSRDVIVSQANATGEKVSFLRHGFRPHHL